MVTELNKNKVVVIGSGFGGLASAMRMIAKGYKVTVIEGNDQIGGRAAVFKEKGYTFDAGPTVITAPYLFDELFELIGEKFSDYVTLKAIDPFYRVQFNDDTHFDYVGEEDRILENVAKISPEDVEGYKKLAIHAEKIFDTGYTKLSTQPFYSPMDMIRVIPEMIKLENYKSVYSLVSKYIKSKKLRQAFSFEPLLVGGNPTTITSIYLLIHWLERKWGVHFAMGGTTAIVKAFEKALKKHGCTFVTSESVTKIETESGKVSNVKTDKGNNYPCEYVISNADPINVYSKMIDKALLKKNTPAAVKRKKSSMGLFVTYFGTKKTYPELKHHTILMGPRYKELLNDIFEKKVLAEDFSLYLHAPTRTDASLAPEGCECFYVLSPVPNNHSTIDWDKTKKEYESRIIDHLEERLLPGLKENLEVCFSITPDYFEKTLQTYKGSGFGIEPRLTQSAYFRFHNKSEDVENLYFVGANTHPGAGVPGVLCSSKLIDPHFKDLNA